MRARKSSKVDGRSGEESIVLRGVGGSGGARLDRRAEDSARCPVHTLLNPECLPVLKAQVPSGIRKRRAGVLKGPSGGNVESGSQAPGREAVLWSTRVFSSTMRRRQQQGLVESVSYISAEDIAHPVLRNVHGELMVCFGHETGLGSADSPGYLGEDTICFGER